MKEMIICSNCKGKKTIYKCDICEKDITENKKKDGSGITYGFNPAVTVSFGWGSSRDGDELHFCSDICFKVFSKELGDE